MNLKKALKKFREHKNCVMHKEAILKLAATNNSTHQGLPFRGHHEDIQPFEGNLYQLLLHQAQDCPDMTTWLHKKKYISPEIVN